MIGFSLVRILVSGVCMWLASKLTGVDGTFVTMLAIAAISGGLTFVPVAGLFLGIIAMFVLLIKWTDANFSDAVILVIVSNLVGVGVAMGLSRAISN